MSVDFRKTDRRYELILDGDVIGYIDFEVRSDAVDMPHTFVSPEHGGQGYAGKLTAFALDDVRGQGRKVIPTCPYIASYIEKHPEYKDLLA